MEMANFGGQRAGTVGLGALLIPLLFLGVADSQLVLSVGPSPVRAALGSDVQLPCTFTIRERFEISKFYLAWSREGHTVAEYVKGQQIYQQGSELFPEELSQGNCSLLLSQVAVQDGGRYTSTVIYTPDKEEKQLELQVTAAPRLSVPRRSGVLNIVSSFPCHVWSFYPGDIDIAWLRDGQVLTNATRSTPQSNLDGTFNLTLTYTFTPTARDSGSIFSCRVSHSALAQPLQEEFPLAMGVAPRISVPRRTVIRNTDTYIPCHVWGFYPEDVTVTWLRNRQVLSDAIRSAPQRNPDGTFNITVIYMFTPTDSDSGSVFSCRISHSTLIQPLEEVFTLDVTGSGTTVSMAITGVCVALLLITVAALAIYCWRHRKAPKDRGAPYSVSKMLGLERCLLGQEMTLSCSMGGTFPEDTAVAWERIHGEDSTVIVTDGGSEAGEGPEEQPLLHPRPQGWRATQERSGTCLTASLTFTPTVQDEGARVRCTFHHEARGIHEQRESGEIRPWAQPQVSGIQVLPDWEPRDQVPFAIQIRNFYPKEIHRIQWRCDGIGWENSEPTDYSQNPDLTFNATSVWRIPIERLTCLEFTVTVSVQQSPQRPPTEREIRAGDTGLLRPPVVSEISQKESVTEGEETTLSCHVTGHFPAELIVTWLRKERSAITSQRMGKGENLVPVENSPEYRIDDRIPRTQDGKSFQQEIRLTFTPSVQRDQGAEYVCRVQHVAIRNLPIEKHSKALEVTARPQVSGIQVLPRWKPRDQVPFAVQIRNFYPREIHRIQWCCAEMAWETSEPTDYSQNLDLTFNATSVWRIPSQRLNSLDLRVQVSIQQTSRDNPVKTEIRARDTGLLRPPVVSEICKPESVTAGEETTLSCRVTGHFPGVLSVSWLRREKGAVSAVPLMDSSENRIDSGTPHTQDGKSFQQETRLSFIPSARRDQGAEYVCRVGHIALQMPMERRSGQLQVTVPQPPVLDEISRPQVLAPAEQVTLSCQISGFYPKELTVTWYRRGRGESAIRPLDNSDTHKIVTPDPTAAPDRKSYSVKSELYFTPLVPKDDRAEYRCYVEHGTLKEPKAKSTGQLELRARPQVSGIQVLPHWEPQDQVPFAIQIRNFYPKEIHRIQWRCDEIGLEKSEPTDYSQNPDLTFNATSVGRIPSDRLTRLEFTVTVSIQQSPRDPPIMREIRARDTGLLKPPEVSEICKPESVTAGEETTLSCHMMGHFPGMLSVSWLRRGRGAVAAVPLKDSLEYRIDPGAPHTQDGKSFQQETRLSFTPSAWRDQGSEYVCRVGHIALQTPMQRHSGQLQVTGASLPDRDFTMRSSQEPTLSRARGTARTGYLIGQRDWSADSPGCQGSHSYR